MSTFNDDLSADMNDPEFAAEFERTNRLIEGLRSDLQDSADALEESADLLEDALNDSERLRAELSEADENNRLRGIALHEANATIARLRAELEQARADRTTLVRQINRVRALDTHGSVLTWDEIRDALSGDPT